MTRVEKAREEYVAALAEERDRIAAELAALGSARNAAEAPPPSNPESRVNTKKTVTAPPKRRKPGRPVKPHGVPGQPGKLSDGSPSGGHGETCTDCGRDDVKKSPGPGQRGKLLFHYAKSCGLPCTGGKLNEASAVDLKAGTHEKGKCPKCDARVAYK